MPTDPLPDAERVEDDDEGRRPMLEALFKATPLAPLGSPIKKEWERFAASAAPPAKKPARAVHTREGERFGRYVILSELGRGGMGVVYRAHDSALKRTVALKLYGRELASESETTLERFAQEARATARLSHRGIVRIHDAGCEGETPYLSMDLVDGDPLDKVLWDLPERQRLLHVVQVARALEHAHAHGVVHRDVKPSNVLIDHEGQAVLVDFGVARDLARQTRLTRTGCIVGTVHRLAPEQVRGESERIGPPADIYALGVLLFEALCEELPFEGSAAEVLVAILQREAAWPEGFTPPPELGAIVMRCLAKEPSDRYGSAGDLAADLSAALDGQAVPGVGAGVGDGGARGPGTARAPSARARRADRRARGPAPGRALGIVAAAVLVCGLALLLLRPAPREAPPPAPEVARAKAPDDAPPPPPAEVALALAPPEIELLGEPERLSAERARSVKGRVRSASPVELSLDGEPVQVAADGSFTLGIELSADGWHEHELRARDAEKQKTQRVLRLGLDSTPPLLKVLAPEATPTASAAVTVRGVVSAADLDRLLVDGRPVVPADDGSFTAEVALEGEGRHEVVVEAVDAVGNRARLARPVVYDATAPRVHLDEPTDGALVRAAEVTVAGRVSDANPPPQVRVRSGEAEVLASLDADGRFSVQLALSEGPTTLEVHCQDLAGHTASASRSVARDSRAPQITLTRELPEELFGARARYVTVAGAVDDVEAAVTLGGRPLKLSPKGRFRTRLPLTEGTNPIEIVALDAAGNRGTLTRQVIYARRRPTKPVAKTLLHEPFEKASGRQDKVELLEGGIGQSVGGDRVFATKVELADYKTHQLLTLVPGAKLRLRLRLSGPTQGSFKLQLFCPELKDNLYLFIPVPAALEWQDVEVDLDGLRLGDAIAERGPHVCNSLGLLLGKPGESITFEVEDLLVYVVPSEPR